MGGARDGAGHTGPKRAGTGMDWDGRGWGGTHRPGIAREGQDQGRAGRTLRLRGQRRDPPRGSDRDCGTLRTPGPCCAVRGHQFALGWTEPVLGGTGTYPGRTQRPAPPAALRLGAAVRGDAGGGGRDDVAVPRRGAAAVPADGAGGGRPLVSPRQPGQCGGAAGDAAGGAGPGHPGTPHHLQRRPDAPQLLPVAEGAQRPRRGQSPPLRHRHPLHAAGLVWGGHLCHAGHGRCGHHVRPRAELRHRGGRRAAVGVHGRTRAGPRLQHAARHLPALPGAERRRRSRPPGHGSRALLAGARRDVVTVQRPLHHRLLGQRPRSLSPGQASGVAAVAVGAAGQRVPAGAAMPARLRARVAALRGPAAALHLALVHRPGRRPLRLPDQALPLGRRDAVRTGTRLHGRAVRGRRPCAGAHHTRGRRLGAVGAVGRLLAELRRRRPPLPPQLHRTGAAARRPVLRGQADPFPVLQRGGVSRQHPPHLPRGAMRRLQQPPRARQGAPGPPGLGAALQRGPRARPVQADLPVPHPGLLPRPAAAGERRPRSPRAPRCRRRALTPGCSAGRRRDPLLPRGHRGVRAGPLRPRRLRPRYRLQEEVRQVHDVRRRRLRLLQGLRLLLESPLRLQRRGDHPGGGHAPLGAADLGGGWRGRFPGSAAPGRRVPAQRRLRPGAVPDGRGPARRRHPTLQRGHGGHRDAGGPGAVAGAAGAAGAGGGRAAAAAVEIQLLRAAGTAAVIGGLGEAESRDPGDPEEPPAPQVAAGRSDAGGTAATIYLVIYCPRRIRAAVTASTSAPSRGNPWAGPGPPISPPRLYPPPAQPPALSCSAARLFKAIYGAAGVVCV
ncbi:A disintegrin and metalloproteinase with thrombospondin motifs 4 isoform X1 [Columba livia]|uniref:A disintegrin and metalloproteinase with thrombospondin motifs 4 isoform X1 n=1 Tax=Columba livia TaxID=8932 RepID=UPI0031BA6C72